MKKKITIPSNLQCLSIVRHFIKETIPKKKFKKTTIDQIVLAIDEACSNIIEHSFEMDESKEFTLTLNFDKEKVTFVIEDKGVGMKISKCKKLNLKKYIKQRKEGGLGKFIIENVMDEVKYSRKGTKNRLSLVKYFDKNGAG
ncbi:MAG: ATP-binding protein [Candidatus Cloacimonadota bacterium]|nr:MAG: ATP-binding protein [Candidatus Cloacimonadota bacterium]